MLLTLRLLNRRCREETGTVGGGGAHILGSPMLFVPFTVPTFPAASHQTSHQNSHQTSHQVQQQQQHQHQQQQQLGSNQSGVQQSQLNHLNLNHLNHLNQVIPQGSTQQPIHSTSCSPQQQAATPNKVIPSDR